MSEKKTLRIDIVSDVVCPWCIIGYRQILAALERTGASAEFHWHPFELNRDMPPEGQNLREHVAEKYGSSRAQSDATRQHITALGEELDVDFRFTDDARIVNTFDAHQLLHWANASGREHDLKMALFTAYFTERRDVSDHAVLVDVAAHIGLDPEHAQDVLATQRYAEDVRRAQQVWLLQGVRGVPAIVFERTYLVSGAVGVDTFVDVIGRLEQEAA